MTPAPEFLSLAFYLPQFHQIPENDRWWGPGFTEWTQVDRARPWFEGHRIRRPVAPLGAYDLLQPGVMEMQYELARAHGLSGFLVWDYWFGGGKTLLEQPIRMALHEGLAFRYALAWANHHWTDKLRRRRLVDQTYLGRSDYTEYFHRCLGHFRSEHYVKVDGKPFFFIYRPEDIPDLPTFVSVWRELARRHGLPGLYLVGDILRRHAAIPAGLDAHTCAGGFWTNRKALYLNFVKDKLRSKLGIQTSPQRFDYARMLRDYIPAESRPDFVPTALTGWDTTPRHGRNGVVFEGLNPQTFRAHLDLSKPQLLRVEACQRILLVKSWNEWAEGNLLEPDSTFGLGLLEVYRDFAAEVRSAAPRTEVSSLRPSEPQ